MEKGMAGLLLAVLGMVFLAGCISLENGKLIVDLPQMQAAEAPTPTPEPIPESVMVCFAGSFGMQNASITLGNKSVELNYRKVSAENGSFEGCGMAVLFDDARILKTEARAQLRDNAKAGMPVILSGMAATGVAGDPAVAGWDPQLKEIAPAEIYGAGHERRVYYSELENAKLVWAPGNSVLSEMSEIAVGKIAVIEAREKEGARVAGFFEEEREGRKVVWKAVFEKSTPFVKSAYFAYDVRATPEALTQAIERMLKSKFSG